MSKVQLPPLVNFAGIVGYDNTEISKALGDNFDKWMRGQTICEYTKDDGTKGLMVYKWDVEAYLSGHEPLD